MNTPTPLSPKSSDGVLRTIIMGRASSVHRDMKSAKASVEQAALAYLRQFHDGPVETHLVCTKAYGMIVDLKIMGAAKQLLATGTIDLVLVMDLRAISRNPCFRSSFVQDCVDRGVRFISPADRVDTADATWEIMTHLAALNRVTLVRRNDHADPVIRLSVAVKNIGAIREMILAGKSDAEIADRLSDQQPIEL